MTWQSVSEVTYDPVGGVKEVRTDKVRIVQQILLTIGGVLALILAAWRTWTAHTQAQTGLKQVAISERGQHLDRYSKAADMLDSEKTIVRQAGIYSLRELAIADDASFPLTIQLLESFIKGHDAVDTALRHYHPHLTPIKPSPPDVGDALRAIGAIRAMREVEYFRPWRGVELGCTIFADLVIQGGNYIQTSFGSTKIIRCHFFGSDLRHTNFLETDIRNSEFDSCSFNEASFYLAKVSDVHFSGCDFENVNTDEVATEKVELYGCNISNCGFDPSFLSGAKFHNCFARIDAEPMLPPEYRVAGSEALRFIDSEEVMTVEYTTPSG